MTLSSSADLQLARVLISSLLISLLELTVSKLVNLLKAE